ncbi:hypothetical protein SAMCFNEI73_Ch1789 [Sinorhizobium americanum]|uniref:Uncharacterized protein n=1 Tax=Sinorhizobium americanum TaxID=194963 RepID=A0A1L3LLX3_9HYPH|nr:hypothetical protein SAMCFNEI73_Ch1789 [Sinorhizobium americanum]
MTPNCDLLRQMIGFAAERLMGLEVAAPTFAGDRRKWGLRPRVSYHLEDR